jgi:hypothetical protein
VSVQIKHIFPVFHRAFEIKLMAQMAREGTKKEGKKRLQNVDFVDLRSLFFIFVFSLYSRQNVLQTSGHH